jgi:hypothetical protein
LTFFESKSPPVIKQQEGIYFLSKFKIDFNKKYKTNQKRKEKGIRKIGRG